MHMWRQVVIQILLFAQLNFLHPNINIHILHTVLVTFTMLLTRRIFLAIRSFLNKWSFPLFIRLSIICGWRVLWLGEIKHQSLFGDKGFIKSSLHCSVTSKSLCSFVIYVYPACISALLFHLYLLSSFSHETGTGKTEEGTRDAPTPQWSKTGWRSQKTRGAEKTAAYNKRPDTCPTTTDVGVKCTTNG